jgi:lysophospholipase L1-like esterase
LNATRVGRSELALAAGSFAFALVLLLCLEGGLRLAGVGAAADAGSRLRYQQLDGPVLRPARLPDGTPVLATADPRLPFQTILEQKPPEALRVFVFGGSATAGLGFSPNVTFARELERMLVRLLPDRRIELVNLGIVAFSSRQVLELVEEVSSSYAPDLLVVYSGNNEFLELHAERYEQLHGDVASRLRDVIVDTNLGRTLWKLASKRRPPSRVSEVSEETMRLSEATLIRDVELSEEDVIGIVDSYEANLEAMVSHAEQRGVPILLMAVASNWRWRGRSDLPDGWIADLAEAEGPPTDELRRSALEQLDRQLRVGAPDERHELLYRRATLKDELGDPDGARADFRAAMNADPHLRRALDAMNARVERVARKHGAPYLDTVEFLSRKAVHGIVGFEEFYDYVHFTPRGAVLVAAELFRTLRTAGFVPQETDLEPDGFARERLEALAALREDPLEVNEWLGFCFERDRITDRDLWKYDKCLADLAERIEGDPTDFRALVYRGNARSFHLEGAAGAAEDYRAALELRPDADVVRANLRALLERRPIDG